LTKAAVLLNGVVTLPLMATLRDSKINADIAIADMLFDGISPDSLNQSGEAINE